MISERLTKLREMKGLTQADVSAALDIPRATYSSYEQGTRMPTIEKLKDLASFFETTTDYLVGMTDDSFSNAHLVNFKDRSLNRWYQELRYDEDTLHDLRSVWKILKKR